MISNDQIREFSKRFAIDEYTIIREYIQIVFLSILYSTKESQKIYFKGGTAIRLLMKSGRFSEDLDFTSELTAKQLEPIVADTVKKMSMTVPDITLKRMEESPMSYTGLLSYQPEGNKYPLTIHLDFSLREKPETATETVLESDFPVVPQPIVRHMEWSEVLAEKIRAFLYRLKGRDVYDLWFMLSKGTDLDWDMINRKLEFYKMSTSLEDLVKRVDDFEEKKLRDDLGKFLPAHDRNLVLYLKDMTHKQLAARRGFVISTSENIDYTKIPGDSIMGNSKLVYKPIYDLSKTKITGMRRQDENSLIIEITNEDHIELNGLIRARSRNGVREIDIIERSSKEFEGRPYDELINHNFTI